MFFCFVLFFSELCHVHDLCQAIQSIAETSDSSVVHICTTCGMKIQNDDIMIGLGNNSRIVIDDGSAQLSLKIGIEV